MKKTFLFAMGALLGGALLFTSCGKDDKEDDPKPEPEVEVDIRDAAIGNYSGTFQFYWVNADDEFIEDEDFGKPKSIFGSVEKDGTNSKSIRITMDGDIYYGNKIAEASNGFTFDIESQTIEGDVKVEGYELYELENASYDGGFDSEENTLEFSIKLPAEDFNDVFTEDDEDWEAVYDFIIDNDVKWIVVEYDMKKR